MNEKNTLRRLREQRGLTKEEAAAELGVSRQSVSQWESGKTFPSTKRLVALSRLYGVPLEEMTQTDTADADHTSPSEPEMEEPRKPRFSKRTVFYLAISVLYIAVYIWGEVTHSRNSAKLTIVFNGFSR